MTSAPPETALVLALDEAASAGELDDPELDDDEPQLQTENAKKRIVAAAIERA
jgi:hypothetical protein